MLSQIVSVLILYNGIIHFGIGHLTIKFLNNGYENVTNSFTGRLTSNSDKDPSFLEEKQLLTMSVNTYENNFLN